MSNKISHDLSGADATYELNARDGLAWSIVGKASTGFNGSDTESQIYVSNDQQNWALLGQLVYDTSDEVLKLASNRQYKYYQIRVAKGDATVGILDVTFYISR